MQCGVRFSAKPSSDLRLMLAQWMGCQRSIYNAKCDEARYFRTFARKSLQHAGQYAPQDQAYAQFKDRELTPWLYDVPSEILRNGAVRYAGGLGPDNIQAELERIAVVAGARPTWVDMEGKLRRTDETGADWLDLASCRVCLSTVNNLDGICPVADQAA